MDFLFEDEDEDLRAEKELEFVEGFCERLLNTESTGKRDYLESCTMLRTVPISRLLHGLTAVRLNLRHYNMGDRAGRALAACLPSNAFIEKLDLGENELGDDAGAAIAEALRENCTLKSVNLSSNHLGVRSGRAISRAIRENRTIVELYLQSNRLGDHSAHDLACTMEDNHTLHTLDISDNEISALGASKIALIFDHNNSLKSINLSKNRVDGSNSSYPLASFSPSSDLASETHFRGGQVFECLQGASCLFYGLSLSTIRSVDLSFAKLDDTAADGPNDFPALLEVALRLSDHTMTELNLSHNKLTAVSGAKIASALASNEWLLKLDLSFNPLGDAAVGDLIDALAAPRPSLEYMGLRNTVSVAPLLNTYGITLSMLSELQKKHSGVKAGDPKQKKRAEEEPPKLFSRDDVQQATQTPQVNPCKWQRQATSEFSGNAINCREDVLRDLKLRVRATDTACHVDMDEDAIFSENKIRK